MPSTVSPGDAVQTPFGKGIIREVRNHGRLLVDLAGRAIVLDAGDVVLVQNRTKKHDRMNEASSDSTVSAARSSPLTSREVDLHGLTVDEALARAESAINDALLADAAELRLIHGRSGGRIRAALHRRLPDIRAVRAFRVDPRNDGVTIIVF